MPAVSKKQQRFMGMVHATQKGEIDAPSAEVAEVAKDIAPSDATEFASTKTEGLPLKKESAPVDEKKKKPSRTGGVLKDMLEGAPLVGALAGMPTGAALGLGTAQHVVNQLAPRNALQTALGHPRLTAGTMLGVGGAGAIGGGLLGHFLGRQATKAHKRYDPEQYKSGEEKAAMPWDEIKKKMYENAGGVLGGVGGLWGTTGALHHGAEPFRKFIASSLSQAAGDKFDKKFLADAGMRTMGNVSQLGGDVPQDYATMKALFKGLPIQESANLVEAARAGASPLGLNPLRHATQQTSATLKQLPRALGMSLSPLTMKVLRMVGRPRAALAGLAALVGGGGAAGAYGGHKLQQFIQSKFTQPKPPTGLRALFSKRSAMFGTDVDPGRSRFNDWLTGLRNEAIKATGTLAGMHAGGVAADKLGPRIGGWIGKGLAAAPEAGRMAKILKFLKRPAVGIAAGLGTMGAGALGGWYGGHQLTKMLPKYSEENVKLASDRWHNLHTFFEKSATLIDRPTGTNFANYIDCVVRLNPQLQALTKVSEQLRQHKPVPRAFQDAYPKMAQASRVKVASRLLRIYLDTHQQVADAVKELEHSHV